MYISFLGVFRPFLIPFAPKMSAFLPLFDGLIMCKVECFVESELFFYENMCVVLFLALHLSGN